MLVLSKGWPFYVCIITILSTNGLAWGQVRNTFDEEPVKPFLQPYSPANDYQSLDASHKTDKKGGKTPKKVILAPDKDSSKSTLGRPPKSKIRFASPEIGATSSAGSGSFLDGYLLRSLHEKKIASPEIGATSTAGSGSFLDGYVLKSLHEKEIVGKKGASDETSDAKKKDFFIE